MPKAEPPGVRSRGLWDDRLVSTYRERYGGLVRLAYLLTGDAAAAEEIVQDAFVASHRGGERLRDPYPYVRTAVVNRCRSWGRRTRLERAHPPHPPEHAELAADEMRDALDRLSERQRAAIVLRFYEDLPDAQIAELLGCKEATVRTAIHRGLARLRKEIDQ